MFSLSSGKCPAMDFFLNIGLSHVADDNAVPERPENDFPGRLLNGSAGRFPGRHAEVASRLSSQG